MCEGVQVRGVLRGRHDARGDCGHCGRPVSARRRANRHSIRPAQVAATHITDLHVQILLHRLTS